MVPLATSQNMKYLVALPLPEPVSSQIADIKDRLRPANWHDTMPPHITILTPDSPLLPLEQAVTAFRLLSPKVNAISIRASRTSRFTRGQRHTLVLLPDDPSELRRLYHHLIREAAWQSTAASTRRPFEPHITLADQLADESITNAESFVKQQGLHVSFVADRICLYRKARYWRSWQMVTQLCL